MKKQRAIIMIWSIRTLTIIMACSLFFMLLGSQLAMAGEGGKIAFSKSIDGNSQIVVTDENGQNLINLSNNNVDDWYPAWSPDGKYITYTSDRDGNEEIYIMNADGSHQRRIINNPLFDTFPSFAPDGRSLVFTRMPLDALGITDPFNAKIFLVDIDGQHERLLTDGLSAEWSPDGKKIAFCKMIGQGGIYLMDADGRNQVGISLNDDYDPSWSPDGKQIVFSSARVKAGFPNIYKMDSDGQNVVRLTQGGEQQLYPIWSPDGQYIAFSILAGVRYTVMVMKADGNDLKAISEGDAPSWFDPAFARKYAVNPLSKIPTLWGKLKEK